MSISNLFGILIVLLIVYLLYRKGLIRNVRFPIVKYKFVSEYHKDGRLRLRYGKYNGVSSYLFSVKRNQRTELEYQVEVEEGSVELTYKIGQKTILHREFFESSEGKLSFTTDDKVASLIVTGKHTKGGCKIDLRKAEDG